MKRQTFEITLNGNFVDSRYSFNASCRSIEKMVSIIAKSNKQTFNLAESGSVKDEFGNRHVSGVRIWRSIGRTLEFKIQKVA